MAVHVDLTPEEWRQLEGRKFGNEVEFQEVLDGIRGQRESEVSSAFGVGEMVGELEIPPLTVGVFPNLEAIDSSLLKDNVEEHTLRDIINATYVACKGREAVREISVLNRRRLGMEKERDAARQDPQLYAVWLAALDAVEQTWMDFEDRAQAFWEEHGAPDIQLVANALTRALNDAGAGFDAQPVKVNSSEPDDDPEKKSTMPSGWVTWLRLPVAWCRALLRIMSFGKYQCASSAGL